MFLLVLRVSLLATPNMTDKRLLALIIVGLAFYFGLAILVAVNNLPVDFYGYLIAAYGFSHGVNVYAAPESMYQQIGEALGITEHGGPYYYPLLTAGIVWPLLELPLHSGAALWVFGSGVSALAAAVILGRRVDRPWKRHLILLAAIGYVPILSTLRYGNVNALVLLATSMAIYAWRQYRERLGGAFLAVGLFLKPLPFALVGLMIWRLRLRTLAWLLLTSLAITAFAIWAVGVQPALMQFSASLGARNLQELNADPDNQNLNGLLARLLTPGITTEYSSVVSSQPLINAPQIAIPLYWALGLAWVAISLALLWPIGAKARLIECEAALVISTTHLVFPLTSYYHLAMLLIPMAVLIESWHGPSWDVIALIVAYFLIDLQALFLALFSGRFIAFSLLMGNSQSNLSYGIGFLGEAIIWVLLAHLVRKTQAI